MSSNIFEELGNSRDIVRGLVFGIDIGIGSCGWAVVDTRKHKIIAMGSRCFDPSEDPKTKTLNNAQRREKRGARRVIARRGNRIKNVRKVIKDAGLSTNPSHKYFQSIGKDAPDPWEARSEGLKRSLTDDEATSALIHIAKHRGFKSNSKRDAKDTEGRKVLSAISGWDDKLGDDRTYGQFLYEEYGNQKRNKGGDYSFTPKRDHLWEEARRIILTQRGLGASWATEDFEEQYLKAAFFQRPLQSSEDLVGPCPFEPDEKRTARFSYSYERFRLIQTLLNRCRISTDEGERELSTPELQKALDNFGKQKKMTYRTLRRLINLPEEYGFVSAPKRDEDEKKDITGTSTGASPGSNTLRKVLSDTDWNELTKTPEILDRIAEVVTFNESLDQIKSRISRLSIKDETINCLMNGVETGEFADFKGTGNISAKAARKLIPEMLRGKYYSEACDALGYAMQNSGLDDIRNPVVKRAVMQAIKQIELMVRKFGRPENINIELLRDVGKSAEERGKMESGINRRTSEREKNEKEFLELVNRQTCSRRELEMYELLKEQACRCPYCDKYLNPASIVDGSGAVQIDHIYPRSRSHENGYVNKVVTCATCNQGKRNSTPWEWRGQRDREWWVAHEARVSKMTCKREKKRRLLSKTFADREDEFIERNKVDASYIARTLQSELTRLYPKTYQNGTIIKGSDRRIFARPGQITAMMRRSWLGERLKKDRDDDRHHAMDALIVALIDEGVLQEITRAYKKLEDELKYSYTPSVDPPWDTFPEDAITAYKSGWLVCRTENRRVRGALHEETIRRMRVDDEGNGIYYERKSIDDLTANHIKLIPDPVIQAEVQRWFDAGKSKDKDDRPKSANGDEIRRLRLPTKIKTARQINPDSMGGKNPNRQGGFVENSNMVRVDVFYVPNNQYSGMARVTKGYYLVPVYGIDIIPKNSKTPLKAIVAGKEESDWPKMNPDHFIMSLYKDSYIQTVRDTDEIVDGYYRGTDRSSGRITVSPHNIRDMQVALKHRVGIKRLKSIRKFHVDRFGQMHEIPLGSEKWPGHRDKSEHHKKQHES